MVRIFMVISLAPGETLKRKAIVSKECNHRSHILCFSLSNNSVCHDCKDFYCETGVLFLAVSPQLLFVCETELSEGLSSLIALGIRRRQLKIAEIGRYLKSQALWVRISVSTVNISKPNSERMRLL